MRTSRKHIFNRPESIRPERDFFIIVTIMIVAALAIIRSTAQESHKPPLESTATGSPPDAQKVMVIKKLYHQLIDAENRHDLQAVRPLVWNSPFTLFVAKTATPAEGNWAGFWGIDVVMQHFHDLYQGAFRIDPDYASEKVVPLTPGVMETYVRVNITVAYAGQTPIPKPFLMILEWVNTPNGWKMATDVALPIPPAPSQM